MSNQSKLTEKDKLFYKKWLEERNHVPEGYYKDHGFHPVDLFSLEFAKAYHLQKLESVSEEDIEAESENYTDEIGAGFIRGAKWLLTHLKEKG